MTLNRDRLRRAWSKTLLVGNSDDWGKALLEARDAGFPDAEIASVIEDWHTWDLEAVYAGKNKGDA